MIYSIFYLWRLITYNQKFDNLNERLKFRRAITLSSDVWLWTNMSSRFLAFVIEIFYLSKMVETMASLLVQEAYVFGLYNKRYIFTTTCLFCDSIYAFCETYFLNKQVWSRVKLSTFRVESILIGLYGSGYAMMNIHVVVSWCYLLGWIPIQL